MFAEHFVSKSTPTASCPLCDAGHPSTLKKMLPTFDVSSVIVPPRYGRYDTKRLRKKWAKLRGKVTVYMGCSVVGVKEDTE